MFDIQEIRGGKILMGNDTYCEITAIGKLKIVNYDNSVVILTKVRYSATTKRNLISLGQLESQGCWFQGKDSRLRVFYNDKEALAGDYKDTLYILDGKPVVEQANTAVKDEDKTMLWHSRLGHLNAKSLQLLAKKELIKAEEFSELRDCEHCVLGKFHKLSYKAGKHTSKEPLEYVHSDLWGSPNVTPSLSRCQYYISFVDDFSRKVWVYFLRTKDEAFSLGEVFWAEATSTMVYMINRTPSTPLGFEIPEQLWTGKKPEYGHMKRFGCLTFYHVDQGKLKPRAKKGVFMGYPQGVKGYRIWSLEDKKCVISRDGKEKVEVALPEKDLENIEQGESSAGGGASPETEHEETSNQGSEEERSPTGLSNYLLTRDRVRRIIKPPSRFDDCDVAAYALTMSELVETEEPWTFQEAMNSKDKLKWEGATEEEMASHERNQTWRLIERPEGQKFMRKQGFSRSEYDHCVYFRCYGEGKYVYLLLYVDDMLVAAKDQKEVEKVKKTLSKEFEMKDLGPARRILGMDIIRDRNKEEDKAETESEMRNIPYSSAVGSLMYAMVGSRPDIAHAVGLVSRYMSSPNKEHWKAVNLVLRYLRGSLNCHLTFNKSDNFDIKGYCDSDHAADLDRRRSITGYLFQVGGNTVSWRSGLQHIVAISTTEAEYMALAEATKEALWLKRITCELGFPQKSVEIFCDSQSAICLAKNNVFHERTKHIHIRFHFIRDVIAEGDLVVTKIDTQINPADILTKSVPVKKFEDGRSDLRVLRH
ncbi:unnamed protein product [Arabidopsis halleri]